MGRLAGRIFGNVLYDEQERLFKMWYLPEEGSGRECSTIPTSPATRPAATAVTWEEAAGRTLKSKNGKPHNAVAHIHQRACSRTCAIPNPSRRYKRSAGRRSPPATTRSSRPTAQLVAPFPGADRSGGDVMTGYWDRGASSSTSRFRRSIRRPAATVAGSSARSSAAIFGSGRPPVLSFTVRPEGRRGVARRSSRCAPRSTAPTSRG